MKHSYTLVILLLTCFSALFATTIPNYTVNWNTPSENASQSMPCGGGDIGLNVWVENGDLLFYIARSGTFDENNTLLKLGRVRVRLTPNPLENATKFSQTLKLEEGAIYIKGTKNGIATTIRVAVDVFKPLIQVQLDNNKPLQIELFYENWRYKDRPLQKGESNQNSYKWAAPLDLSTKRDQIAMQDNSILFFHRNVGGTVFDQTVTQQGLSAYTSQLRNPLNNLTFGGIITAKSFKQSETSTGIYADTDYKAWKLETHKPTKTATITIQLHTQQSETVDQWKKELTKPLLFDQKKTTAWWTQFWNTSFIYIQSQDPTEKGAEIAQNYQLFRYMLGCNAFGTYPTKFNGGLFTVDPVYTDSTLQFTPDFRKWGGGTHTAQNQRLVYFPFLKSGDTALMKPQFDFYLNNLQTAELRSKQYWNHSGACFTEQLENFGLPNPSEYGWKRPQNYDQGMEYNAWLEYQWDTVLEFCFLILENERYTGADISTYIPLITSSLLFFDEHYTYLAKQRGRKILDDQSKLVFYPGSACETYKMAYNATSTLAALQVVTSRLLALSENYLTADQRTYFETFLSKIPAIKIGNIGANKTIAPAWLWERVNNTETPQLYPVFPWGIYGLGKPDLEIARNTWNLDPDVQKFRSHVGWKQDAIWAARLGLVKEAKALLIQKMESASTRFPTFWGPGFDWTPDHNWGGSGMITLQEMLLQADGKNIILLPTWPKEWDVHFKLHAPYQTTVECKLEKGVITSLIVTPKNREQDFISPKE